MGFENSGPEVSGQWASGPVAPRRSMLSLPDGSGHAAHSKPGRRLLTPRLLTDSIIYISMEPKKANRLQLSAYLLYYSTYSANFPLASATATLEPAAGCAKHADLEAQTLLGGAPTNETFDLQIS